MAPYTPAYLWLNESSDSCSDGEDVPHEHTPLGRAAKETLAKLKERTPAHIREVRYYWYDLEECKYKNVPKDIDCNDMFRNVGILITMPDSLAQEILDRVTGKADQKKLKSDFAKMMAEKLSGRPEKYLDQVTTYWHILKTKRNGDDKEKIRMFKDIGLLLQIPDQEVHEMIWILLNMIEKGEIAEEEGQRIHGTGPAVTPRVDKYPKGIRPRHRHPKLPETLSLEANPAVHPGLKRPASEDGGDEQPTQKKARWRNEFKPFAPKPGNWKCGLCGYWNFRDECQRRRKDKELVCGGRRLADTMIVKK
ncbi:uncharacterized protein K460DRAFT_408062 [Cucurbitaria berberidis CBS 394.84]|uniref:Uncharacterized protein n=1 Tax=Cucurbitaria berberidis CBS 394.84 TaxID=1168544 RepID=A0A9P4L6X5_9PLEO|nr:uncharacterized protein K460DRAFT_408062 [Cucurbitaria berberidis CBS 394.84]KAF1843739.1 hypothetical protein K460DRAFT_408062 [Cucurbitaria berberidis CBS 394.84]